MRPSRYLPRCCTCFWDNGRYVAVHWEESRRHLCRHTPSGGHAGKPDGHTRIDRLIGQGYSRADAIAEARAYLGLA